MSLYRTAVWPFLRLLDPEAIHDLTLSALERSQGTTPGRWILRRFAGVSPDQEGRPVEAFGLTFPNPLGVAAGFDKDARVAAGLAGLGFGHVEVGTLTPRPQEGNPRPRIFRLAEDGALINRLGFPNRGVEEAVPRLAALAESPSKDFVLGISLGKQKETPLERAVEDYLLVLKRVYPFADYLAVNVSSPNTPELRQLQGRAYLDDLVGRLVEAGTELATRHGVDPKPLLVKISPDLEAGELAEIIEALQAGGTAGVIATNTTVRREGLKSRRMEEKGGLSGRPLRAQSTAMVAEIHRLTAGRLPIVGVGGVRTVADVVEKLEAGASLVQTYTGLIYEGPGMAGRLTRGLDKLQRP